ncbi:MAG: c-type cytochrome [Planctomycetota bacterium]|nr:c-type cytochrome [Planctomycetota bacterium]
MNCAHCHGLGGAGTAQFRLQVELGLEETGLLDSKLTQGDFGIHHAQLVAPGDPYRSVLYYRMAKLGRGRMPHIGSYVVDEQGLRLMRDWIQGLSQQRSTESSEDVDLAESRADQIAALQDLVAGRGDQPALIDRLLQTLSGGLVLAGGMHENQFTSDLRERIITQAAELSNPQIRDLFEDFVPEQNRRKRVELESSQVLAVEGNASRGEQLFFDDSRLQCRNCHQIGERGKPFGPDLTKIGRKRDASTLLTSLLSPSEKIEPEYVPFLVITTEGMLHSGLLVERTAESVVLKDSQSKQTRLSTKQVVELVPQKVSLMPVGQLHDMALQDVADLLAYLQSRQ